MFLVNKLVDFINLGAILNKNLREERLRQRELGKLQSFEKKETNVDKNFSSGLEKFKVDVTKEH